MEEQVGEIWHRFISRMADVNHPEASVSLSEIRRRLSVFYHALSADAGLQLDTADAIGNPARRSWLQRLAGSAARIRVALVSSEGVSLPIEISHYADAGLNRDLYYWLAAMAAVAREVKHDAGISPWGHTARYNQQLTCRVLQNFPGMRQRYENLVDAHIRQRPPLPQMKAEQAREMQTQGKQTQGKQTQGKQTQGKQTQGKQIQAKQTQGKQIQAKQTQGKQIQAKQIQGKQAQAEQLIRDLLSYPQRAVEPDKWACVSATDCYTVPLWLHIAESDKAHTGSNHADSDGGRRHSQSMRELEEIGKRRSRRVDEPESERGLITVRMENIFSMGEFVNVDRGSEEDEDIDRAESVARDLDELAISRDASTATATLKFDLDLPPASADDSIIDDGLLLPEWDWKRASLVPDRCRIVEMVADSAPRCELPDHLKQVAGRLRKQFQALAPAKNWKYAQADGQDIDLDAYIRFVCERASGSAVASNLYRDMSDAGRELSCLLLADLSLSTDAYIDDEQRIIDVIRDSLYLFAECLQANGDHFSLYGFSSRRRDPVRLHRLKTFDENYDAGVRGRIDAIKPGYYTRLGAAIRFASRRLIEQGIGKRLLLVLTDGKPNDLDQYEGRYGIEDTRNAIQDARRQGLIPFCVTIDRKGSEYLPYLFGRNNYVVIRDAARLPRELPRLYALFARAGE
jgi:nitric oxide reductase NorD protein